MFGGNIVEGGIYEISNFYPREAIGSMRPVTSPICLRFNFSTTVQRVLNDDWSIPLYKFEFVHLRDLYNYVDTHSTDGPAATTIGTF